MKKIMKKVLIVLPIMAGMLFLGGCGEKDGIQGKNQENNLEAKDGMNMKKESAVEKAAGGLKDLLSMGKTIVCVSVDDGVETKMYIKGKKYKSETKSKDMNMIGIFDEEAFYNWNTKTKAGTKMTMACIEELEKDMPKNQNPENSSVSDDFGSIDEVIEEEEDKDNCKETNESIDFSLPADISFVDQCAMLKNMTKEMQKIQKDMPLPASDKMTNLPAAE